MDIVEVAVGIIQTFLDELLFFGSRIIRATVFYLTHLALFRIWSKSRTRVAWQVLSWGRDHRFVLVVHRAWSADIAGFLIYGFVRTWRINHFHSGRPTFNSSDYNIFGLRPLLSSLHNFIVAGGLLRQLGLIVVIELKLLIDLFLRHLLYLSLHTSYAAIG